MMEIVDQLESVQKEREKLRLSCQDQKEKLKEQEKTLEEQEEELARKTKDLKEQKIQLQEQRREIEELEGKLRKREEEINESVENLEEKIREREEQLEEAERKVKELEEKLKEQEEKLKEREEELEEEREKVDELEKELEGKEKEVSEIRTKFEKIETEMGNLRELHERKMNEFRQLQTRQEQTESELSKLKTELSQLSQERGTPDGDGVPVETRPEVKVVLSEDRKYIEEYEDVIEEQKRQLQERNQRIRSLEGQLKKTPSGESKQQQQPLVGEDESGFDDLDSRMSEEHLNPNLVTVGDVFNDSVRVLSLTEKFPGSDVTDNVDDVREAWRGEKESLVKTIEALKELLIEVNAEERELRDWRGDMIKAVHKVYSTEKETLRWEVRTAEEELEGEEVEKINDLETRLSQQSLHHDDSLQRLFAADRQSMIGEMRDLKRKIRAQTADLEDQQSDLQEKLNSLQEEHTKTLGQLKRQMELVEYKLHQEGVISDDLRSSLDVEKERVAQLSKELARSKQLINDLTNDLQRERDELQRVREELEGEQSRLLTASAALDNERQRAEDLTQALLAKSVHANDITDTTTDVGDTKDTIKPSTENDKLAISETIEKLQSNLDSSQRSCDQLTQSCDQLTGSLSREKSRTSQLEIEISQLRDELEMVHEQRELTQSQHQVALDELQLLLKMEKLRSDELNKSLSNERKLRSKLESTLNDKRENEDNLSLNERNALNKLQDQLEKEREKLSEIQKSLEKESKEVEFLNDELQKKKNGYEEALKEERGMCRILKADLDQSQDNLRQSQSISDDLLHQLREKDRFNSGAKERQEEINRLRAEIGDLTSDLERKDRKINQVEDQLRANEQRRREDPKEFDQIKMSRLANVNERRDTNGLPIANVSRDGSMSHQFEATPSDESVRQHFDLTILVSRLSKEKGELRDDVMTLMKENEELRRRRDEQTADPATQRSLRLWQERAAVLSLQVGELEREKGRLEEKVTGLEREIARGREEKYAIPRRDMPQSLASNRIASQGQADLRFSGQGQTDPLSSSQKQANVFPSGHSSIYRPNRNLDLNVNQSNSVNSPILRHPTVNYYSAQLPPGNNYPAQLPSGSNYKTPNTYFNSNVPSVKAGYSVSAHNDDTISVKSDTSQSTSDFIAELEDLQRRIGEARQKKRIDSLSETI